MDELTKECISLLKLKSKLERKLLYSRNLSSKERITIRNTIHRISRDTDNARRWLNSNNQITIF